MNRRSLMKGLASALPAAWATRALGHRRPAGPGAYPAPGAFQPTWESLQQYQTPEWFRDAKFGIWAHWGPQCQPEHGDWYARSMYEEGSDNYKFHVAKYGHPSKFGFKDVIHQWKAETGNPTSCWPSTSAPGPSTLWRWLITTTILTCLRAPTSPGTRPAWGPRRTSSAAGPGRRSSRACASA